MEKESGEEREYVETPKFLGPAPRLCLALKQPAEKKTLFAVVTWRHVYGVILTRDKTQIDSFVAV